MRAWKSSVYSFPWISRIRESVVALPPGAGPGLEGLVRDLEAQFEQRGVGQRTRLQLVHVEDHDAFEVVAVDRGDPGLDDVRKLLLVCALVRFQVASSWPKTLSRSTSLAQSAARPGRRRASIQRNGDDSPARRSRPPPVPPRAARTKA